MNAYDELVEVIATGPSAERIVHFRASEQSQQRVAELLAGERSGELTPQETAELDRFLQFEHLMRLAKARAQLYLKQQSSSTTDE